MASTRFSNDVCRQTNKMQQMTGIGRYMLDAPGPGSDVGYVQDPSIRIQKWGGNLWSEATDLHSELSGRNQPINRDCLSRVNATSIGAIQHAVPASKPNVYSDQFDLTTDQSRATMPAWELRDQPQTYTSFLLDDPQRHTENPFRTGLNTKRHMKDTFRQQG